MGVVESTSYPPPRHKQIQQLDRSVSSLWNAYWALKDRVIALEATEPTDDLEHDANREYDLIEGNETDG